MSVAVVIGAQWGDEGKGKAVDVFSSQADYVVRYQGGANAGHTLNVGGEEVILHLIPAGILHSGVSCVISAGVALDVVTLCDELKALEKSGRSVREGQLYISDSSTLLLSYHKKLDQARERFAGHDKIGTTGKGIGPAYEGRASRKALTFSDLFLEESVLFEKLYSTAREKNFLLEHFYKEEPVSIEALKTQLLDIREILRPYRCKDTSLRIYKAIQEGKKILFEGAQGSLLDILHGTYPYVTSSSTLAGSACTGVGVGPKVFGKVLAIVKAYTTRVGSGPFPTECENSDAGAYLQSKGKEFGATTGRRRRCGWLDLVALKYAIRLNGITNLALMKLDVLTGLEEIYVCTSYDLNGKKTEEYPTSSKDLENCKPNYKIFKGWTQDIRSARTQADLPKEANDYIDFISYEVKTPIDVISVGPSREETLWLNPLFVSPETDRLNRS